MVLFTPLNAFKDSPPKFLDEALPLFADLFQRSIIKANEAHKSLLLCDDNARCRSTELAYRIRQWEAAADQMREEVKMFRELASLFRDLLTRLAWLHETVWFQQYTKKVLAEDKLSERDDQSALITTITAIDEYHTKLQALHKRCYDQVQAFEEAALAEIEVTGSSRGILPRRFARGNI